MQAIGATFAAMIGAGMLVRSIDYEQSPGPKHLAWMLHAGTWVLLMFLYNSFYSTKEITLTVTLKAIWVAYCPLCSGSLKDANFLIKTCCGKCFKYTFLRIWDESNIKSLSVQSVFVGAVVFLRAGSSRRQSGVRWSALGYLGTRGTNAYHLSATLGLSEIFRASYVLPVSVGSRTQLKLLQ